MNNRLKLLFAPILPPVARALGRHWSLRIFNLAMMALVMFVSSCALKAADGSATNTSAASLSTKAAISSSTNTFNVLDDKYRLAVGDQLSFQIIEDEDDPKPLSVTDSGDVQIPYIGRYPAVGKTCKELAMDLKAELEKQYYYKATVVIAVDAKPRSRGKIYLVGAVRSPGSQEIASDETLTVSRAILRAGGFADFADQKNVRVTRNKGVGPDDKKAFIVNVARIFEKGKTDDDLQLQPGDLVYVPERMVRF
jgi:protein involved in polysaccharide export with SLBB domain